MSDPQEALQRALRRALVESGELSGLIGARVYDDVPASAQFPYITIGEIQSLDASAGSVQGTEAFIDVHLWSRGVGRIEARRMLSAVSSVLHLAEPPMTGGHRIIEMTVQSARIYLDEDGRTSHGIVAIRALTEQE